MRTSRVRELLLSVLICLNVIFTADAKPIDMPVGAVVPDGLSLIYDPNSGRLSVSAPSGSPLTALEIESTSGQFTKACEGLGGPFDVCFTTKVFKMDVNGFASVNFGPILPANLSPSQLVGDLAVDGATLGGGFNTGSGVYLVHPSAAIPEPSSWLLLAFSSLFAGGLFRRW